VDVIVNGEPCQVDPGLTVRNLVSSLDLVPADRGFAVAVDGEVVPRGEWERTPLHSGARVEIVVAVQGG
jgi:sulfur carrier protein